MFHPSISDRKTNENPIDTGSWNRAELNVKTKKPDSKTRIGGQRKRISRNSSNTYFITRRNVVGKAIFEERRKFEQTNHEKKFHVRYVAPSRIPLERLIGSLSLSLFLLS